MSLFTLPNSTTGFDNIFAQTIEQVPIIPPMLLLFVFFVVFLGGISRQKFRTNDADYSMWAVVASIGTLIIALIMSMASGMISLDWLVIVVVLNIFSGVWLFLDKKDKI